MHWVVCDIPEARSAIRRALRGAVWEFRSWSAVRPSQSPPTCLVVVAEDDELRDRPLQRVAAFRALFHGAPILLVHPPELTGLPAALVSRRFDETLLLSDISGTLRGAISYAMLKARLFAIAEDLQFRDGSAPSLRSILALLLRADPPFRTVNSLGLAVNRDPSGLRRQWNGAREAMGFTDGLRLQELVAAVVLLHGAGLRLKLGDWDAATKRLGVHRDTLARRSRSLLGWELLELERREALQVWDRMYGVLWRE